MTAHTIRSALQQGACGVQMGTAFLTCTEAGTHPVYKKILLETTKDDTVLTKAFSGKMARAIRNAFVETMSQHQLDIVDFPIQNAITRYLRNYASQQNIADCMSLWAGQNANLCQDISVKDLMAVLAANII